MIPRLFAMVRAGTCDFFPSPRRKHYDDDAAQQRTLEIGVPCGDRHGINADCANLRDCPGKDLAVVIWPWLFGIDVSGVDTRHIFKAFMGLYLALAGFWIAGAVRPKLRRPALWSLFIFMVGLAAGRGLSILTDGQPSGLLIFYLLLEISFGAVGWWLLQDETVRS